jgi:phosphoglycolate phosphatase|tara:strand:- start:1152 stop:1802 length:651 start_codon:yes stop_codon:yes gene_type:complete
MKCEHIIWDWNGTLLDDVWLSVQSINKVLSRYDLPPTTTSHYLNIFTFPVIIYYKLLGFNFETEPFEKVGTEFIEEYTSNQFSPKLHKDSIKVLDWIHESTVSQTLVSAATQKMLEKLIHHHKLEHYFDDIIGQDNHYAFGKEKSVLQWLKYKNVNPSNVLFIGDTIHDHDVADNLGLKCILISHGHTNPGRLMKTGSVVLPDLYSLINWFKENNK